MSVYLHDIEDDDIYEDVCRALQSKELVLFAGAGLSAQAKTDDGRHPPMWTGLLTGMIDWCCNHRMISTDEADGIRELVNAKFLADAGQELQDILGEPAHLQECLADVLLCNRAKISDAHRLVVRYPFRAYLTVNYDEFIEGAYWNQHGRRIQRFYQPTIEGVLRTYRQHDPFIFKLHGDISDPSSVVLGNRSYDDVLYFNSPYQRCIESIFSMSSVLFVGFGANDPDLEGIISRVAALDGRVARHWIVTTNDTFPPLKIKRLRQDKGINVICYQRDNEHSGLVKFLAKLGQPRGIELLNREVDDTLKVFERGDKISVPTFSDGK